MGAPDFESRRLARLQESDISWEPLEFPLFSREWECVPLIPLEAIEPIRALRDTDSEVVQAMALHSMLKAAVVDKDNWQRAVDANMLDAETLGELCTWLGDEYAQRYKLLMEKVEQREAYEREQQEMMIPHPPPVMPAPSRETPREKDRRLRAFKMAQLMQGGAEIPAPEDTDGYEVWEMAQAIFRDGADPEVWGDG